MAITRRQLFGMGGALAATSSVVGITSLASPAQAAAPVRAPRAAGRLRSSSPLVAMDGNPAVQWPGLTGRTLADPNCEPQSLAFDNTHGAIYALQVAQASTLTWTRGDGQRVAVRASYGHDQHAVSGDLCLTRMDLAGNVTGVMYLLGFGHGVGLGVEPDPGSPTVWIWTECQAQTDGATPARGNLVCRFPFVDKALVTSTDVGVTRYAPVPGATSLTPSVDVNGSNRLVTIRYHVGDGFHYSTWDLDTAVANGFSSPPLATRPEPVGVGANPYVLQGWTTCGRYLYLLDGAPDGAGTGVWSIRLTSCDLNDGSQYGSLIAQNTTDVDAAARPRMPQGLAMYSGAAPARLAFMVKDSSTPPMTFDVAYKNAPA